MQKSLENNIVLRTFISKNHLIVLEERVDTIGNTFVLLYNLYLKEIQTFDTVTAAIEHLCSTTCTSSRLSKSYLNDVEFFVHTFGQERSFTL